MKKLKNRKIDVMGREFKFKLEVFDKDGLCCPHEEIITVNPEAANIPRTVIHETVHSVFFSGGLFEALDNEKLIEVICEQFARVMDENFEVKFRKKCLSNGTLKPLPSIEKKSPDQ